MLGLFANSPRRIDWADPALDAWKLCYGRKIETALEKKESGHDIKFVAGQEYLKQVTEYKNKT